MSSISPSSLRLGSTDTDWGVQIQCIVQLNVISICWGWSPPCHDEQRSILTSHQGVQHNTWKWLIPPLYQFLQSLYFSLVLNLLKKTTVFPLLTIVAVFNWWKPLNLFKYLSGESHPSQLVLSPSWSRSTGRKSSAVISCSLFLHTKSNTLVTVTRTALRVRCP